ncbi:MAG: M67 family metallopeptidase [Phycisphaeraceae bacterium]
MDLHLPASLMQRVHDHGAAAYPGECCGFLLGVREADAWRVQAVESAENAVGEAGARQRYEIAPRTYLQVDRAARARGWDIVGIYHTHPDAPPRPSKTDLAEAWPAYVYLIVTIEVGQPTAAAAWTLGPTRFEPVALHCR